MPKLTVIDRANKYAEQVMRYYQQHNPNEKATKVAFEEAKHSYIAGWRAAKKDADGSAKKLARVRRWATKGKSAVLMDEEFDQIADGTWEQ